MDDKLIEAVARAIKTEHFTEGGQDWEEYARAAIAAHNAYLANKELVVVPREPTDAMLTAGVDVDAFMDSVTGATIQHHNGRIVAHATFKAMIQASRGKSAVIVHGEPAKMMILTGQKGDG